MLGKVMKYEFKATGRLFLPAYAAIIAMAIVCRLSFGLDGARGTGMLPNILIIALVMMFTAMWVMTLILIIRRFWDNLLGREGYLMHTLPVKPWQHIMGKMLTSTIWCICGLIITIAAFALLMYVPLQTVLQSNLEDGFKALLQYIRENELAGKIILAAAEFAVCALLSCFSFILMIYCSMSVGQLANRHRGLLSVGAFIGINIVLSAVASLFGRLLNNALISDRFEVVIGSITTLGNYINGALIYQIAANLVLSALFFFGTEFILRKKLNLQ